MVRLFPAVLQDQIYARKAGDRAAHAEAIGIAYHLNNYHIRGRCSGAAKCHRAGLRGLDGCVSTVTL